MLLRKLSTFLISSSISRLASFTDCVKPSVFGSSTSVVFPARQALALLFDPVNPVSFFFKSSSNSSSAKSRPVILSTKFCIVYTGIAEPSKDIPVSAFILTLKFLLLKDIDFFSASTLPVTAFSSPILVCPSLILEKNEPTFVESNIGEGENCFFSSFTICIFCLISRISNGSVILRIFLLGFLFKDDFTLRLFFHIVSDSII